MKKQLSDLRPLLAVSKAMPTSIDVLEASLDALAKMHARKTGIPFPQAFDDLLQNDETAREFYADLRATRRDPSIMAEQREQLRKRAEAEQGDEPFRSDAERRLDDLADEYARGKSITKEMAYTEILKTDEGRELYAKHHAKRRAAA
jgi:hypothetical protein